MSKPTVKYLQEQKCLHVEAEGCIVNIRQGLYDKKGRRVTNVEIIPDEYAGERLWRLWGSRNNRIIQLLKKYKP